ncbi:NRPS-like enzyme [Armillaria nabsnona]|nr:NRPS-like enzyme [Armillaria nabsnona]
MAFPTPQGLSSLTFSPPPVDGSLMFPELVDYNGTHSPDHALFRYEDPDGNDVRTIYWSEGVAAFHTAGRYFKQYIHDDSAVVIGILANSDTLTIYATIVSIMRLGYIPFPISVRNSAPAVAHLMKTTNAKYLIISGDPPVQAIADLVCHQYDGDSITTIPMPKFNDIYSCDLKTHEPLPPFKQPEWTQTALILHSSGTTGFPSPISLTHEFLLQLMKTPYYGEVDLCGEIFSAQSWPMYHTIGFWITSFSVSTGAISAHFHQQQSATITADRYISSVVKTNCTYVFTVPSFLEQLVQDPAAVQALKATTGVLFGGGPLSKETGDNLARNGIRLLSTIGSTEAGCISVLVPKFVSPEGWEWMRLSRQMDIMLVPTEEKDICGVYVKKSVTYAPAAFNSEIDGIEALDMKDLVQLHPSNRRLWKVYGRADEQITHSTGEKTNPEPIEAALMSDRHISGVIMFGRGKFQPGVLVQPSPEHAFDPKDTNRLAEYRSLIWESVAQVNNKSTQHSRIYKEMILVTNPSKPFEFTAKGTLRRGDTLKVYEMEINEIYNIVDAVYSPAPDTTFPQNPTIEWVTDIVRDIVKGTFQQNVGDDDDIFLLGGDSLTATLIRNSIIRLLQKVVPVGVIRSLPSSFVFDKPTVTALGAFVYAVILGASTVGEGIDQNTALGEELFPEIGPDTLGQTIVKLHEGQGEPPLIMIPGAGGLAFEYMSYADKFRTAVWTLQVTSETPLNTLEGMAAFYFQKIKAERPLGPYRFAAYSQTSVLLIVLVKLFEDNGDVVLQAAMLDHFPALLVYSANLAGNPDPRIPENMEAVFDKGTGAITEMMSRDGNPGPLLRSLKKLNDAWHGKCDNDIIRAVSQYFKSYLTAVSVFVYTLTTHKDGRSSMEAMAQWLQTVKAPISVIVALKGCLGSLPEEDKQEWRDLGAKGCLPNARVDFVDGGHYEFLTDDKVIRFLQEGY